MQRFLEIGRGDAGCGEFRAEFAGRVGELGEDGVERGTCAAGVDAGVGKLADDGDGELEAEAQGVREWRGVAERLRQTGHAGVRGIGAL
ncbi:hypothetical protein D3C71_1612110 [compost metagenome]